MISSGQIFFISTNLILFLSYLQVYKYSLNKYFINTQENFTLLGLIFFIIHTLLFLLTFISYLKASFTDPGYMKKNIKLEDDIDVKNINYCLKCTQKQWKPMRAHHCKTCKKCVFRMDHHCYWINNCVGVKNQKFFILFLLYAFLYSILSVILLTLSGFFYLYSFNYVIVAFMKINFKQIMSVLIILVGIYFSYYTISYLQDQYDAILENQTTVESEKNLYGAPDTFYNQAKQIFGNNIIFWILPTKPLLECNYLEKLYTKKQLKQLVELEDGFEERFFNDQEHLKYKIYQKYKVQ